MENLGIKEAEEKAQRAKQARIQADKEKEERAHRVKQLVNIDAQQDGVMDRFVLFFIFICFYCKFIFFNVVSFFSLMEALSSGSAFSRERQRKKGPRIAGGMPISNICFEIIMPIFNICY